MIACLLVTVVLKEYPPQTYYGDVNYNPETGLGPYIHHTQQPAEGFYDINADIDRFFPIALEEVKDLAAKYKKEFTPMEINRLATTRAMKYAKDVLVRKNGGRGIVCVSGSLHSVTRAKREVLFEYM